MKNNNRKTQQFSIKKALVLSLFMGINKAQDQNLSEYADLHAQLVKESNNMEQNWIGPDYDDTIEDSVEEDAQSENDEDQVYDLQIEDGQMKFSDKALEKK